MENITALGAREWFYCSGSQAMQEDEPDTSTMTSDNKACRWLAGEILDLYVSNKKLKFDEDFIGKLTPNDVLIDDEMYEAAKLYVTDILKHCNTNGLLRNVIINKTVNLDSIYPGLKGTPDAWLYDKKSGEITIWSFSYEYGHVDVVENPELLCYALGIVLQKRFGDIDELYTIINFRSIQPRSFHSDGPVREWIISAVSLKEFFTRLQDAAHIAMNGTGQCSTGTHCRYCKGRYKCSALSQTVYNAIDVVTGINPETLTGNNLSVELKLLKRIEKLLTYRLSAIEKQVETALKKGAALGGFMLKQGYGRKRWIKDISTSEVVMMGDLMGVDLRKPDNIDTPTQALSKLNKKAKEKGSKFDASIVEQYFETPKTGLKVIEDDGKLAKQVFSK